MTVSDMQLPPSRAGSLPLVGGSPALDFANTESGRGTGAHQNHLRVATDILDWLDHAGTLSPEDSEGLRAAAKAPGDVASRLLESALSLRSAIQGVGAAIGRGAVPDRRSLASLSALYAQCVARGSLEGYDGLCRWRWDFRRAPVEAALGPIALAAVELFTHGDFDRIKECGGHECGWLFYDTSKNNRRRWCEMEICGNRAKQKRLASRRKGA
jgi:predicted RNA-binding Zn ribbon-like protein